MGWFRRGDLGRGVHAGCLAWPAMSDGLGFTVLVLGVYVLAAARVTRLVNADRITDPVRVWAAGRASSARRAVEEALAAGERASAGEHRRVFERWMRVYEFLSCPWCVGFWVALAGAVPVVVVLGWSWWAVVPVALAASQVIGLGAALDDAEEIEVVEQDAGV